MCYFTCYVIPNTTLTYYKISTWNRIYIYIYERVQKPKCREAVVTRTFERSEACSERSDDRNSICTRTYAYTYIYAYVCTYMYMYRHIHLHIDRHIYIYTYICTHYTYMYKHVYVYNIYIYMFIHVCVYIQQASFECPSEGFLLSPNTIQAVYQHTYVRLVAN